MSLDQVVLDNLLCKTFSERPRKDEKHSVRNTAFGINGAIDILRTIFRVVVVILFDCETV